MNTKTATVVGSGIGLVLFLAVGLLPATLYGGYAGILLATGIFGAPLASTWPVQAMVAFGMALGALSIASLFAVLGAVAGAAISTLANQPFKGIAHKTTLR